MMRGFAIAAALLLAGCAARLPSPPRTIITPPPPPCRVTLAPEPTWAPPTAPADARERLAATLEWGAAWRSDAIEARAALAACGQASNPQ